MTRVAVAWPLGGLRAVGVSAFGASLLWAFVATASAQSGEEVVAASAVYVRSDTNDTTVVSPRLRVAAPLAEGTRADVTYTVDVWTSASVDIVTAATPRVTEQRDEIDAALSQTLGDATITLNYRYSSENDYESHGGTLGGSINLAQNNTTVAFSGTFLSDDVGMSGDPSFQRDTKTVALRGSVTQVIDRLTVAQLIYEYGNMQGYLSSPYRYVGFYERDKPMSGTCEQPSFACYREENPDARTRNAIALRARRALTDTLSVGLGYRYYADDWEITSHTIDGDVAWTASDAWAFDLDYRYYTQGSAAHYEPFYYQEDTPELFTTDKELTELSSNRVGLQTVRTWFVDDTGTRLRSVLSLALIYYSYPVFPRLDSITAFESTLALEYLL